MGKLSIIISLAGFVAAILQIILFFKVWGMCNDVRAMRRGSASNSQEAVSNITESKVDAKGCGWIILAVALIALIVGYLIYNN